MKVGILTSPQSWYAQDLLRASSSADQVCCLNFAELQSSVTPTGLRVGDQQTELLELDSVIVRTMPPGTLDQVVLRMDVLHLCEARGVQVVNAPRAVETAVDKYLATARLQAAGLRVPATWAGQRAVDARRAFEQLGGDVVCKPVFGSEGRGILRLSDPDLAGRAFATLEHLGATIYLQQFIPHRGYDWRILVIHDRCWGMQRTHASDWRTNVHRGAIPTVLKVTSELESIAQTAAAAIGARWAGIDILPGLDNELYVLEVNAVPGWRALAQANEVDIAAVMWQDLRRACVSLER